MANAELLSNLYNAFASGDIPTVLGSMDPEIRWHQAEGHPYMASGEAWVGPDAVLNNLFVKLGEDWDEFAVAPSTFHDAGDVVAVEGRYTGTHSTTGKSMDAQFCHIWTLRHGKITKFQQYTDTAQLQAAFGAS